MNADLKRIRTEAESALLDGFIEIEESLPGNAAVQDERRARLALLERDGLPHRRIEQWKYTDLRSLVRQVAHPAVEPGQTQTPKPLLDKAYQIVMVDGFVQPSVGEVPAGIHMKPFADALNDGDIETAGSDRPDRAIDAINAAFARDGFALTVAPGVTVSRPIELVFLRSQYVSFASTRVAVKIGAGASVTLMERHIGPAAHAMQSSTVTQYRVGAEASVDIMRVQDEGDQAIHLGEVTVDLDEKAAVKLLHVSAGARVSRTETRATFNGQFARFDVAGLTMVSDRQHSDHTLYVDHLVPNCESTETFKSVIDDRAKAIFQGKIVVAQDAQKTDAQMAIDALLLSDAADMVAKPELEIFADDVSCAHGATCGDIDEDLMFYLLARGLAPNQARKLLLQAFLADGTALFEEHAFQNAAFAMVEAWLTAHAGQ